MLGTLNGALEVRGIPMPSDAITAEVEGINEVRDRVPVLTAINIRYRLRVPGEMREKVDRALETHQAKCPTAQSLAGAVHISWTADIEEV
jgi:organic hydroperoxide reductase OsmC/OhrA